MGMVEDEHGINICLMLERSLNQDEFF